MEELTRHYMTPAQYLAQVVAGSEAAKLQDESERLLKLILELLKMFHMLQ
eukprot:NODE_5263_length_590_cov_64.609982_g4556_i0.p2 GENE.NODE_5263_length_590_cov_64.609982_g4556_i0~~NODE_5263_length_590_cov_64.609982_g4556_i0.p2  ORF type:complete len:50 (+),score=7.46 NODE_5263_length_590_cov_64.609982_g4556_i0:56-205(+)